MNSIVFMPSIMPNCGGGCSDVEGFLTMILTLLIVGIILYVFGIFVNILHIKISNGFSYTPISWHDIKPGELSNTVLGWTCGIFGFAFIGTAVIIGLVAGVYWIIVTL